MESHQAWGVVALGSSGVSRRVGQNGQRSTVVLSISSGTWPPGKCGRPHLASAQVLGLPHYKWVT